VNLERLSSSTPPPATEREIAALPLKRLAELLPEGWQASSAPAPQDVDAAVDITAPDGRPARVLVVAKTVVNARDVPALTDRLARWAPAATALVAARYLSPRTRTALAEAGLSFADLTGNLRVSIADPGLAVLAAGANRDPYRSPERPTNSLRGIPAAKVVRALVDRRRSWTMRELAAEARTSLGSTARTIAFLDREALIERNAIGSVVGTDWEALLRRWADDYDIVKPGRVLPLLAPRGLDDVEASLARGGDDYVISGSLAARRLAPYADAHLGLIYARDADELAVRAGARRAPSTPNLVVIEPTDDFMWLRSERGGGLRFAAPSQVFADLNAGPGRSPEEALALLEWMRRNEDGWRRP
jgi:hypothetical protein